MEINIITKNNFDEGRRVELKYLPEYDSVKLSVFRFSEENPTESVLVPFKSLSNYIASVSKERIEK